MSEPVLFAPLSSQGPLVPLAPAVLVPPIAPEPPELVSLRAALRKKERPGALSTKLILLAVSLAAFVWASRELHGPVLVVLVAVLFFHELGHFLAMRALGYRDTQIFFVPFLGAAASGRAADPSGWKEGIVTLAGPLPGLLIGAALMQFAEPGSTAAMAARMLVAVNGLNLLPFHPLDGGRLWSAAVFSRVPILELAAMIGGAIGIVVTKLVDFSPSIVGGMAVGLVIGRARLLEAAKSLRGRALALDGATSELPTAELQSLQGVTEKVVERARFWRESTQAGWMIQVHDLLRATPAPLGRALALIAIWAAAAGIGWRAWETRPQHQVSRVERIFGAQAGVFDTSQATAKVDEMVKGGMTAAQARRELARLGARRLDAADLDAWNLTRLHIAERSPELCASYWTGAPPSTAVTIALLDQLPDVDLESLARTGTRSVELEIQGGPVPVIPDGAQAKGVRLVREALPAADRERFFLISNNLAPSQSDECWAMKTLLRGAPKLDATTREGLLRALVSGG